MKKPDETAKKRSLRLFLTGFSMGTAEGQEEFMISDKKDIQYTPAVLGQIHPEGMTAFDKNKMVKKLEREMKKQADQMNFELAIAIRNKITELKDK